MFFSPHNFLGMTRESLSPSSGPCEEARKCSRVGEAPSTTARRQQIRLRTGSVGVCYVAAQPKAAKRQTSEGRAQPTSGRGGYKTGPRESVQAGGKGPRFQDTLCLQLEGGMCVCVYVCVCVCVCSAMSNSL